MPSPTSVVNNALRRFGGTRIDSLDDGSVNAGYAIEIYADLRDELLSVHEWNFATKRAELAMLAAEPVFEFQNAFALPADCLRIISVHDNDAGVGTLVYRVETLDGQKVIVASREDLWLRYVFREEDPNNWSPSFITAMQLALARDLALPVASSHALHDRFAVRAERALARARFLDSTVAPSEPRPRGSWVTSRGGRRPRVVPLGST